MSECCGTGDVLIYACSGGCEAGRIADLIARKLHKMGAGVMGCLASVGAHMGDCHENPDKKVENIVIDGCPLSCARKLLEHAGKESRAITLDNMGVNKKNNERIGLLVNETAQEIIEKLEINIQSSQNIKGGCCS